MLSHDRSPLALDAEFAALFDRIDFLAGLGETVFFDIENGSTLFVDDLALDPVGASALSANAIRAAGQHFAALQSLLERADPPRLPAFALLRAALDAASSAIWLLEPDDRDERASRALRRHWADLGEAEQMSLALTASGASSDDTAAWTRAHSRWFVGVPADRARMALDTAQTVAAAAEVVEAFTEVPGAAAVITSGRAGFGSVAMARYAADGELFAGSLSMALDVAETAISLFHARAVTASQLPDDAATLAYLRGR